MMIKNILYSIGLGLLVIVPLVALVWLFVYLILCGLIVYLVILSGIVAIAIAYAIGLSIKDIL